MTDYYPLLARALDALPDRSPALRRAVYERARGALIGQLRSLDPPVPEADIELERKSLDAAIERLETAFAEAAEAPPEPAAPALPEPSPEALPEPEPPPRREPEPEPAPFTAPPPEPPPVETPTEPAPVVPFVPTTRRPRGEEPVASEAAVETAPSLSDDAQPPAPANEDAEAVAAPGTDANGRQRPRLDVVAPRRGRTRLLRNLFVGAVLATVIALIAVTAFLLRDEPSALPQQAEDTPAETEAPDAKFADRVGGERPEAPPQARTPAAASSDVTVAQRAVLYEEDPANPKTPPVTIQGRAVWRTEAVNGEAGEPLQTAVRATIEYPEAGLTLTMTIRRNLDQTLPASHTIELAFTNYGPGAKRAVQNIGLIQGKDEEAVRGAPVSGLPVRVRENLFLIGLSSLKGDVERNTEMLLHRNWFDLAVSYAAGPRALLTFEKGNAGAQAMQSAFDQWRN